VKITPLRGAGVVWLKCPACRLKCRPTAVGPDGGCPRCDHARMLRLSFGERAAGVGEAHETAARTDRNTGPAPGIHRD
jgi:hypothetical protein